MNFENTKSVLNTKEAITQAVPPAHGVYFFKASDEILYIGKSVNLKARLLSHLENARQDNKEAAIIGSSDTIEYIVTDSEFKALLLESELIRRYKPKYNARWRDDKSHLYIKVSIKDPYPKLHPVRREQHGKSLYFGPFPSVRSIEEILKEIRRIFPFCTQKQIGKQRCFYAKIKLCDPCPSEIEKTNDPQVKQQLRRIYRANIRQVIRILEGQTDRVLKGLYKQLKKHVAEEQYEQAIIMRDKIVRFEHLLHDRIFSKDITQVYNESKQRTDTLFVLLAAYFPALAPLMRVECYDISNLSQKEATASMVVFTEGISDKSQYRRFRIKNKGLQSDFDMLEEVLTRRLRSDWPRPDLVVVDGGKPQVRKVLSVFSKHNISTPVVGIAKHPDRLVIGTGFLPTVRPPVHHAGFNMVRAIRDESHRFAKKYHLLLRNRKMGI